MGALPWAQMLESLLESGLAVLTASPIVAVVGTVGIGIVLTRLYQRLRWAHLSVRPRDPVRTFSGRDRSYVLARADHRCEHYSLYAMRCPTTTSLQVDHIHPHSRGGSTTVNNAQVLCKAHNRRKGARIPFTWELRMIERKRQTYAPDSSPIRRREVRQAQV